MNRRGFLTRLTGALAAGLVAPSAIRAELQPQPLRAHVYQPIFIDSVGDIQTGDFVAFSADGESVRRAFKGCEQLAGPIIGVCGEREPLTRRVRVVLYGPAQAAAMQLNRLPAKGARRYALR